MTPELPCDPPLQTTRLRGGSFTWCESGEGPVLLAVHGSPGSVRDFRWLASATSGVRFIRMDMPGYGGSDWASGPGYSLGARGRFVLAVAEALGIERFCLLGHSQGGGVVTSAAAQAPDRVCSLALLASIGPRMHKGFIRSRVRLVGNLLRVPGLPRLAKKNLERGFEDAGFPTSLTHAERVQTVRSSGAISFSENRRNLARLRCPTLVAWAEDDRLVESAVSRELAEAAPAGPRLPFETGGHNLQKTCAVEIGEALSAFVGGG